MEIGRRERRKQRTRRALLAAALELFGKRGIYSTRLEDITQAADLGKGAFYNYFGSKDELTAALLDEAVDLLHRVYLLNVSAHSTPMERVVEIARCHRAFFDEHPVYLLLFHQAQGLMLVRQGSFPALKRVFATHLSR
ncbi:MAG: TetR/AcrR family transcriptional regulator, partial [Candidatus Riflebacteria bacterium]|nr:TetR/AcrR family transcriptional regulator [Candidatus Riflebacteria bacterium]